MHPHAQHPQVQESETALRAILTREVREAYELGSCAMQARVSRRARGGARPAGAGRGLGCIHRPTRYPEDAVIDDLACARLWRVTSTNETQKIYCMLAFMPRRGA
jgi:hypothetical protein